MCMDDSKVMNASTCILIDDQKNYYEETPTPEVLKFNLKFSLNKK